MTPLYAKCENKLFKVMCSWQYDVIKSWFLWGFFPPAQLQEKQECEWQNLLPLSFIFHLPITSQTPCWWWLGLSCCLWNGLRAAWPSSPPELRDWGVASRETAGTSGPTLSSSWRTTRMLSWVGLAHFLVFNGMIQTVFTFPVAAVCAGVVWWFVSYCSLCSLWIFTSAFG